MSALLMLRGPSVEAEDLRAAAQSVAVQESVAVPATIDPLADRALMEEILAHGRIRGLKRISVGVSGSSKASVSWQGATHDVHVQSVDSYLVGNSRHVNQSDCYRYNVAAYRLDRMLELGMVPVSVERSVAGQQAAVTWWIDDVEMMELERRKMGRKPIDPLSWNRQMHRAAVFQELIANADANQTNLLITGEWKIWLVDFTRAFRAHRRLSRPQSLRRLDPELRAALERLDRDRLRTEMKGLLLPAQISGILARRDLILRYFAVDAQSAAAS